MQDDFLKISCRFGSKIVVAKLPRVTKKKALRDMKESLIDFNTDE